MNKLFACLFLGTLVITSSYSTNRTLYTPEQLQELTQKIENNVALASAELSDQDLQLFTNIVYFCYGQAAGDFHLRLLTQTLTREAKNVTDHAHLYMDQVSRENQLSATNTEVAKMFKVQQHLYGCWKQCSTTIKTISNKQLQSHIQQFTKILEQEVLVIAKSDDQEFDNTIKKTQQSLQANGHALTLIAKTFQAILDKDLPLKDGDQDLTVEKIAVAAKVAHLAHKYAYQTIESADQIIDQHMVVQQASMAVFDMYYNALYSQLKLRNKKYHKIMFNADGILPVEKQRELLPAYDLLFENLPFAIDTKNNNSSIVGFFKKFLGMA